MAEAVFLDLLKRKRLMDQWRVESAGVIDYHVGKTPDHRTMSVLSKHGINDYKHRVRQVREDDFRTFDFIFGMDEENIADLQGIAEAVVDKKATVELLGKYDPDGVSSIPDPYYGHGTQMFEMVYEQCLRSCTAFLEKHSQ